MSGVSQTHSSLLYGASPVVPADGTHQAVIKIKLRDDYDRPVAGRQTEILADSADVTIVQPDPTDENGMALAYVSSATPGPVTISARVFPLNP